MTKSKKGTAQRGHHSSTLAYPVTLVLLAAALAFPFGLMVFDPTLMFERGWEQYVGTGIYIWAVLTLIVELVRLWHNETAFRRAAEMLDSPSSIAEADRRLLPSRLRTLAAHAAESVPTVQLMELNRESSALDGEHAHGRFTLTRYILYLLPVIGFIGTVEGISKALMNISKVLPMVKELDGFLSNLTGVTAALQIAFDSTLLALFLSAALMLAQTLVVRRLDDLLARVDGWVVEHVLPRLGTMGAAADPVLVLAEPLEQLRAEIAAQTARTSAAIELLAARLGDGLGSHVDRFAAAIDRLPDAALAMERAAIAIGRMGDQGPMLADAGENVRRTAAALARIEAALAAASGHEDELPAIRRGVDRAGQSIDALAGQWAAAFEKSSRVTQEQLARTLGSLKDALELLHVSMDQGNALYRTIVKKLVPYSTVNDDAAAA
jgi:biopolymer transport protein ExbB/TolQ